jgi:hypothetical protein
MSLFSKANFIWELNEWYLFFHMALGLDDFEAGKSITQAIGGPKKSRLFWAQMKFASHVAISEPKKVSVFRAHPFQ